MYCHKGEEPPEGAIVIWEDEWHYRREVVISRIRARLGLLHKIPGRLGRLRRITRPEAGAFLEQHHLQGATNAKYSYGLFLPAKYFGRLNEKPGGAEILLAVMTFSGARTFRDGTKSYELIRFAVRCNYHVHGAFSRLLQAFIREKGPDSVMTYVDRNWYRGGTYEALGFEQTAVLPPIRYRVTEGGKRVPVQGGDFDVINKGSVKMLWRKKSR